MKGEVVIVIEGRIAAGRWSEDEVRSALATGLARGQKLMGLSTQLSEASGWPAKELYRMGLGLKG